VDLAREHGISTQAVRNYERDGLLPPGPVHVRAAAGDDGESGGGRRLAAVSALQVIPDVRYVGWLAERLAEERPFIGYHAMVALLSAARGLSDRDFDQVALALTRAKHLASHLPANSDRARTLGFALEELTRRRVTHQAGRS
jgi:hypothetical protein